MHPILLSSRPVRPPDCKRDELFVKPPIAALDSSHKYKEAAHDARLCHQFVAEINISFHQIWVVYWLHEEDSEWGKRCDLNVSCTVVGIACTWLVREFSIVIVDKPLITSYRQGMTGKADADAVRGEIIVLGVPSKAMNILTVNLLSSTFVFWVAARIYVLPKLPALNTKTLLVPILLLHAFRHLGLMFLAPGAIYAGIPPQFAYPAAFGDLLAALLALIAIPALLRNAAGARLLVWVFNVVGTLDLFSAITLATIYGAQPYMGAAYWIPAFWVPALLVTHYITFVFLWKYWKEKSN